MSWKKAKKRKYRVYNGRRIGPNLQALYEERVGENCLICDGPVPQSKRHGRKRVICDDKECQRAYLLAARSDSYHRLKNRKRNGKQKRLG